MNFLRSGVENGVKVVPPFPRPKYAQMVTEKYWNISHLIRLQSTLIPTTENHFIYFQVLPIYSRFATRYLISAAAGTGCKMKLLRKAIAEEEEHRKEKRVVVAVQRSIVGTAVGLVVAASYIVAEVAETGRSSSTTSEEEEGVRMKLGSAAKAEEEMADEVDRKVNEVRPSRRSLRLGAVRNRRTMHMD